MIITHWKATYKSVKGKEIPVATIGRGSKQILIIGCMHGDEPAGKYIALKLIAYYEENKLALSDKKLIIIPVSNPDGYEAKTRCNASGVDLNRNFPTKNWNLSKEKDDYYSGNSPASEPETKTIIDLINEFRPELLISLHQPYKVINYDGPAEKMANLMSEFNGYEVVKDIGYPTPGSLGSYAGIERNIPVITLELPEDETDESIWKNNKLALITVINNV